MTARGSIRVGVGGWTYEPWDQSFYPAGLRKKDQLSFAASQLSAIEINGTFYRTQKPETFANWRASVPDNFKFAVKAPRYTVQKRILAEAAESIARFVDSGLAELNDTLGPILWQLPPTKKFDAEDFAAFLDLLPRTVGEHSMRHAVELRHSSFVDAEAIELCRAKNVAIVLAADSDYPMIADQTADFSYLRIMGTEEQFAAGYAPKALDQWTDRLRDLAAGKQPDDLNPLTSPLADGKPREVYAFVISGYKAANPAAARELIDRLGDG